MKISYMMKMLINGFEDLLFKNHVCLCCSREVPDGTDCFLCDDCKKHLDKIDGMVCQKCGEKLEQNVMVCDSCKDANFSFDRNFSCFYYTDTASTLVKKFKYSSKKYYGETLAKLMSWKEEAFEKVDIITFVPISKSRKRERGFNQAEVLAENLAKLYNLKVETLLIKDDGGKHQAGLKRKDRLSNLSGTIHFDIKKSNLVKGKNILIVDDVFTTGTTLDVCAAEIRKFKPKQVKTLTFAKTKFVSSK